MVLFSQVCIQAFSAWHILEELINVDMNLLVVILGSYYFYHSSLSACRLYDSENTFFDGISP